MFEQKIQKDVVLAPYSTLKIGGKARYFCTVTNNQELVEAIQWAKEKGVPFFILGAASNILISDKGWNGLVIKMQNLNYKLQSSSIEEKTLPNIQSEQIIEAEAGVPLAKIVGLAFQHSLTGMEWAIGIPGTVGGAIYGNAGAFGSSMAEVVKTVCVLDVSQNSYAMLDITKQGCDFSYRSSLFKHNKQFIIISAHIHLQKGIQEQIAKKMKECFERKKQSQPLDYFSAGSIFKNFYFEHCSVFSLGTRKFLENFSEWEQFQKQGFIPAAWLIEKCGLKGKKIGRVELSLKHANFIVHRGGGSAKDVKKLINLIKKQIKEKFGIELQEEIEYLGF